MKKSELIEQLNKIPGDLNVAFRNVEYEGYEEINYVYVEKTHRVREDGTKICRTMTTDYSSEWESEERLAELYQKETCSIIVVDVVPPFSLVKWRGGDENLFLF